ncbi:unnamed protein product [Paramecium sonneborni]|uniref:Transmembrane protein n=1 Tax=Paramecium sonneborni TaxID=65129 RepID=A0A8S1QYK6_9CILI|nr:unnamed protein product [Paramecium sonneborni]
MKINLVDIFLQDEYIYILDHENGVKRVFLEDNKIDNDFYINQTGCQLISIFKDSAILVQQNQQRSIIYEGIINNKSWTLLQSKQISKKIIKNIKHLQHYALLLSNPINNIHRKYMIEQYTDKQILQGDDFYQMDFLGMENLDSNYLIGIFKYGIALYYTMEKPSTIVCSAQIPQINRIKIKLISTQCPNQNQTDLLNYCSSELEYVFEVRGALMNEFQERIFIYLCIGASIIVWLLVVSIIYIIRRYQMKKNQINEMKMKKIKPK